MKCIDCAYLITCKQASEQIKQCEKFKKIEIEVSVERKEKWCH